MGAFIKRNARVAEKAITEQDFANKYGLSQDECHMYMEFSFMDKVERKNCDEEYHRVIDEFNYKCHELREKYPLFDETLSDTVRRLVGVHISAKNPRFVEFQKIRIQREIDTYAHRFGHNDVEEDILHIWDKRYYLVSRFLFGVMAAKDNILGAIKDPEILASFLIGDIACQSMLLEDLKDGTQPLREGTIFGAFRKMAANMPVAMFFNPVDNQFYVFKRAKYQKVFMKLLKRMVKLEQAKDLNMVAAECYEREAEIVTLKLLKDCIKEVLRFYEEKVENEEVPDELFAQISILRGALDSPTYTMLYQQLNDMILSHGFLSIGDPTENRYKLFSAYIQVAISYTMKLLEESGAYAATAVADNLFSSAVEDIRDTADFQAIASYVQFKDDLEVRFLSCSAVNDFTEESHREIKEAFATMACRIGK